MKERIKKVLNIKEVFPRHYVKFILVIVIQTPFGLLAVLAEKYADFVQDLNDVLISWVRK